MTVRQEQMTGLERARKRRRQRAITILAIVSVLVISGFAYAIAYVQGVAPGAPVKATPTCTPRPEQTPPQGRFTLNIYNSSTKTGEANTIASALATYGFSIGVVGNDPYKRKLADAGEIRFGAAGASAARTQVAPKVPGARLVQDGRTGTSVDIAVGEQFPTVTGQATTEPPEPEC